MQWDRISCRHRGSVVVLDLVGRLCLCGEGALSFTLSGLWEQGDRRFLLNMAEVPYIDSGCLGEIVRFFWSVRRRGGCMALCAVNPRTTSLLETTRLSEHIRVFDTEDAGVLALEAGEIPDHPEASHTADAIPPEDLLPDTRRDLFSSWPATSSGTGLIDDASFWVILVALLAALIWTLAASWR